MFVVYSLGFKVWVINVYKKGLGFYHYGIMEWNTYVLEFGEDV